MVRVFEEPYVGFKTRGQSKPRVGRRVRASSFPEFGDLFLHDAGDVIFAFLDLSDMPTTFATSKRMRDLVKRRARELLPTTKFLTYPPFNVPREELPKLTKLVVRGVRNRRYRRHITVPLSRAIDSGGLGSLTELHMKGRFTRNEELNTLYHIGDEGLKTLSSSVVTRKMGSLVNLTLSSHFIGDEGMKAFSSAIKTGALANLSVLCLEYNRIGNVGMIAFTKAVMPTDAIPAGSLSNLKELNLGCNKISNHGMASFSYVISTGALGKLKELYLFDNKISDAGMIVFARAITPIPVFRMAALSNLTRLILWGNNISDRGTAYFSCAIARGALANLEITSFCQIFGHRGEG